VSKLKGYLTQAEEKERRQKFQQIKNKVFPEKYALGLYKNYVGKQVMVMTVEQAIYGTLKEVSQYEILLENEKEEMIIPKHAIRCVLVGMGTK